MAKSKWAPKHIGGNLFIEAGDVREILAIIPPSDILNEETGELVHHCASFTLAGPKGGSFSFRLPDYYWLDIANDVEAGNLVVGDGIDAGGWAGGKFVKPRYYSAA